MHIPLWDAEGFLVFGLETEIERFFCDFPSQAPIDKDVGLARRHPERAALYSWVHPAVQSQARTWGTLRRRNERL